MSRTPTPTTPPDMAAEQEAHAEGFARVCGIDEAGRGPLAGAVVAAAVGARLMFQPMAWVSSVRLPFTSSSKAAVVLLYT